MKKHNPKIFLSYSYQDKQKSNIIAEALTNADLEVYYDQYEINNGNSLTEMIYKSIKSSDYFVILISSESIKSKWVLHELNKFLSKEMYSRDIVIVPVLLSRCKLPETLKNREKFNLSSNFEKGLNKLVSYLKNIPYVDFKMLDAVLFEELIKDLLERLKFNINESYNRHTDYGFDIKATYNHKNPFGGTLKTNWIFQLKFYRNSRADISSLNKLSYLVSDNLQGVLVTNGQLTSAARRWLNDNEKKEKTKIKVIDGIQLKELVLKYPDLVEKYFHREEGLYE